MSLAQRSISSVTWNAISNLVALPVGLVQSIILARLLPVEYFGIYAGVLALVMLVNQFFEFGLNAAFVHRSAETEDESRAIDVLFTLRFFLYAIKTVVLLLVAIIFFSDLRRLTMVVLAVTGFVTGLANIPGLMLIRRVQHRRLAIMSLTNSVLVAVFSIWIAVTSASIWALLISSVVTLVWTVVVFNLWKPIWRPRFVWDIQVMKYYLSFGGRAQINNLLGDALDSIDDLWTNIFLGDLALGFYSRAYKFASYPRVILAAPVSVVATGTYAELKSERERLSKAFFRVNALMIRSGFLLGGWLFVIAPEFILIFLGEQWLPMLSAFRLMLVFTLLDPLRDTVANAIVALGMPEKVITTRVIQLGILLLGLFSLGFRLEIAGVALAVNTMLVAGIALLFYFVRAYIDISYWRLFFAPVIALVVGLALTWGVITGWDMSYSNLVSGLVKSGVFGVAYLAVIFILEGRSICDTLREIIQMSTLDRFIRRAA